jgi:hypothetical protein
MMRHFSPFLLLVCFVACMAQGSAEPQVARPSPARVPEPDSTIAIRFAPPQGFTRVPVEAKSFGAYLRGLPLKPEGAQVHLFDGSLKRWQGAQAAVIDMSVGKRDLQQCADAIMRLWAEHLFAQGRIDDIHFHFTNGFLAEFTRWANGDRIKVSGNTCQWKLKEGRTGTTHENLLSYLQQVFTYAGTLSLSKELRDAHDLPLEPGDVFIHGGSPGHAMIVVDVARDARGRTAFLLAQSYMPAQDIHVVKNLVRPELGAWFIQDDGNDLITPEWTFGWNERKRW